METVRSKWTDERLDDFRAELREYRTETRGEFAALRAEMNARFDSLNRTMLGLFGSIVVGFLVTNL